MRFFVRCETLAHVLTQLAFFLGTEESENPGACPKNARAPHVLWGGEFTVNISRRRKRLRGKNYVDNFSL